MDCSPVVERSDKEQSEIVYANMRCVDLQYPGRDWNEVKAIYGNLLHRELDAWARMCTAIELVRHSTPEQYKTCVTIARIMNDEKPSVINNDACVLLLQNLSFRLFYPTLYDYVANSMVYNGLPTEQFPELFLNACTLASSTDDPKWVIADKVCNPDRIRSFEVSLTCDDPIKYAVRELPEYQVEKVIGEGTFGSVSIVNMKNAEANAEVTAGSVNETEYVCKTFKEEEFSSDTLTEISALTSLVHPNVVFIEYVEGRTHPSLRTSIFMKRFKSDLSRAPFPEGVPRSMCIRSIMRCILRGLEHIHSKNIIHRDLKPQNILVNNIYDVRIADFGMAKYAPAVFVSTTWKFCTPEYRAPEIMFASDSTPAVYNTSFDMWSAGCIFYELLTGKRLFPCINSEYETMMRLFWKFGKPTFEELPEFAMYKYADRIENFPRTSLREIPDLEARNLVCQMLTYDIQKRISAKRALEHPYFA